MKFLKNLKNLKKLALYLISLTAVIHLILSSIQIKAISALTDQICGLVMFMFILIGFVCLFNALRLKEVTMKKLLFCSLFIILDIAFGGWLLYIYFYSVNNQPGIELDKVIPGIVLSICVMTLYFTGLILTIISYFKERKANKGK